MRHNAIAGALAVTALLSIPALAICAPQDPPAPAPDPAAAAGDQAPAANAAPVAGSNTAGAAMDASQMPPGQVHALQSGDNTLVANAPVPDTPANRAKYGKPLSHGGKSTPPAGN
ncbi:MAG: hypothetical protein ABI906_07685 [Pseudomonadota bacterium]